MILHCHDFPPTSTTTISVSTTLCTSLFIIMFVCTWWRCVDCGIPSVWPSLSHRSQKRWSFAPDWLSCCCNFLAPSKPKALWETKVRRWRDKCKSYPPRLVWRGGITLQNSKHNPPPGLLHSRLASIDQRVALEKYYIPSESKALCRSSNTNICCLCVREAVYKYVFCYI